MKLFLSLPMNNRSAVDIAGDISYMKKAARDYFVGEEIEFVCAFDEEENESFENAGGRLWYLGRAIQMMDGCDAILLSEDSISFAKGCDIEAHAARNYGLDMYEIRSIPGKESAIYRMW